MVPMYRRWSAETMYVVTAPAMAPARAAYTVARRFRLPRSFVVVLPIAMPEPAVRTPSMLPGACTTPVATSAAATPARRPTADASTTRPSVPYAGLPPTPARPYTLVCVTVCLPPILYPI